jgi:cytochrome d ubiquinol oxidase subunit II
MIGLAEAAGLAIVFALNIYGLTGGADYGGGVWDLLASGPRAGRQRDLVARSLAPIWEANHVWLVLAVVVLATAFPPAFARISTTLHVPLLLTLLGIVARGAAFSFRSYGGQDAHGARPGPGGAPAGHRRERRAGPPAWGRVFAVASLATPLLLGTVLGAITSGVASRPRTAADFFASWVGIFPLAVGIFALVLFAFLAAVYLAVDAREAAVREDFRLRALACGLAVGVIAAAVLVAAARHAPALLHGLVGSGWSMALHAATAVAALAALAALWSRRYRLARLCAAAQVSLILWGWALAQQPYLVRPDLTLGNAAAPPVTLRLLLGVLAAGAVVTFPAFYYLFRVFGRLRQG